MKFIGFRQMFLREEISYWATPILLSRTSKHLMPAGISEKEFTVGPILKSLFGENPLVH
jgi:hypothetical protein